jgi:hypothetical protein
MTELVTWIESWPTSVFVRESNSLWAFPMFLCMHTIGVSIVAGGGSMISFALLGIWPSGSIKPLERLYPYIWGGFAVNLFTGLGLLLADLGNRGQNPVFWTKMALVGFGVYVTMRIRKTVFDAPDVDRRAPGSDKVLAWAALVCWFGAIVGGRLIAYVGGR